MEFATDFDLLCNENREFLYEKSEGALPTLRIQDPNASDIIEADLKEISGKKRKRNAEKDRLRIEAEQNAYKKLKQIVPSLRDSKRVTKLETICEACSYIEALQKTLAGIRK